MIGSDGAQLGVMQTLRARQLAEEEGLDLVEISPTAKPPVCKIMDYGKYKYEQEKKRREAKKHQSVVQLKEVKLRPATDKHDLEVKLKHIRRFLEEGNKAKITVKFRGREMAHKDLGMAMLKKVIEEVGLLGKVDQTPSFEGKMLSAVLAPNPAAPKPKKEKKGADDAKVENE